MIADPRRFAYALEPLRQRRRWELDALTAELGRAQREVDAAEARLRAARDELAAAIGMARAAAPERDPARHGAAIGWLVLLRGGIQRGEERLAAVRAERERVCARLLEQQRKVEVVERHREEALREFVQEEEARIATEGDREWLARRSWSDGVSALGGDE